MQLSSYPPQLSIGLLIISDCNVLAILLVFSKGHNLHNIHWKFLPLVHLLMKIYMLCHILLSKQLHVNSGQRMFSIIMVWLLFLKKLLLTNELFRSFKTTWATIYCYLGQILSVNICYTVSTETIILLWRFIDWICILY